MRCTPILEERICENGEVYRGLGLNTASISTMQGCEKGKVGFGRSLHCLLFKLLSERGILNRLAFKGGTCLRKMFIGSHGRFSTDLDFTGIEEHDHEDIILEMMQAFDEPFHGIQFAIPDGSYYETQDGLSWGVNPTDDERALANRLASA